MTMLNKYGEIAEGNCPECGKPIKPDWKACPECGIRLGQSMLRPKERAADVSYVCPGCGERATASDGKLCPKCRAFVHKDCLTKGQKATRSFGEWFCENEKWQAVCPLCSTPLGTIRKFETMHGYAEELDDGDI